MTRAQTYLVLALRQRYDGIGIIGRNIQKALSSSTGADGVREIAQGTAYLYSSDVVYKDYTTPLIAKALHSAGIAVGGSNGESIESGQFVPDLGWLSPAFVATKLERQGQPSNAGDDRCSDQA